MVHLRVKSEFLSLHCHEIFHWHPDHHQHSHQHHHQQHQHHNRFKLSKRKLVEKISICSVEPLTANEIIKIYSLKSFWEPIWFDLKLFSSKTEVVKGADFRNFCHFLPPKWFWQNSPGERPRNHGQKEMSGHMSGISGALPRTSFTILKFPGTILAKKSWGGALGPKCVSPGLFRLPGPIRTGRRLLCPRA